MTTEIRDEARFTSGETDKRSVDLQMLFAQSLQAYQVRGHGPACEGLRRVARLARANGNIGLSNRAESLLGLILFKTGDLAGALHWLHTTQREIQPLGVCPWRGLLATLMNVATALLAAEQAQRTIAETQTRLEEEISLLELEVEKKAGQLWSILTEVTEQMGPGTPTSWTPDLQSGLEVPAVAVRLLGCFQAKMRNGTPLELCTNRKGQALFLLLVSHPGRRFHRETLLDLLWRQEDPAVATGKLHIAVSRLRRSLVEAGLGEEPLLFEQDTYRLNERLQIKSDLSNFRTHVASGQKFETKGQFDLATAEYEAALELYGGGYLAEWVGEEWTFAERAQAEEMFLQLLERLSRWDLDNERYIQGATRCQLILQHDNLREDIYRRLMLCLSHSGKRNQALLLYQDLKSLLDSELGVEPMRATRELFTKIRSEDVP